MLKDKDILAQLPLMLKVIRREVKQWKQPIVGGFNYGQNAPYQVLISTVLSLRTKDKTTEEASRRLFALADSPQNMLTLSPALIEKNIYPVGFYRTKARVILKISRILIEKYGGIVPDELDELLTLPGVGRKTANLVISISYNKPAICVDTHVHRISNRWGLVKTKTPEQTEVMLREILPKRYWMEFNELLVCYGQNLCLPVSPHCSRCKIRDYCPRLLVKRSR